MPPDGEDAEPQVRDDPDLEVPGAPTDDGKPLTVLQWLAETDEEQSRQQRLIDEAEVRERIVLGEQWRARDAMLEDVLPVSDLDSVSGLICENLLYPLVLTWAARVDQGRVDVRAYPFQPTPGDVAAAKALNTILDYEKQQCGESELIAEAAVLAQCHGDALFYPQWSMAEGPFKVRRQAADEGGPVVDPMGQPVMEDAWEHGGVVEEVIAAPDYVTSGQDHYGECEWLRVRRIIPKSIAKQHLREAGFADVSGVQENDYPTAVDTSRRGVECYELWLKPGPRAPQGAYALVVAKKACVVMEYPRDEQTGKVIYDGKLPGDVWKIGYMRGSSRGKTHVSDAIHQQRLVNVSLRSILARAEVAASAYLVGPTEVIDQMPNAKSKRVGHDSDKDIKATTMWFGGPEVPSSLFGVYDRARAALHDVFGVSEATTSGGDPTQTKSGKQLMDATALDAQKIRPARGALEQARKKVAKDKATLWQVHADLARLVRVLGPTGGVEAQWLKGADVGGADIALEIGSGIQSTHLAGQRYAEESAEAGYMDPTTAGELRETGLPQTVGQADMDARVDAQARKATQGQPEGPLPDVDPARAVQRLSVTLAALALEGKDVSGVVALAQAYQALAAQNAAANAQQPDNGQGAIKPGVTETRAAQKPTPQPEVMQ